MKYSEFLHTRYVEFVLSMEQPCRNLQTHEADSLEFRREIWIEVTRVLRIEFLKLCHSLFFFFFPFFSCTRGIEKFLGQGSNPHCPKDNTRSLIHFTAVGTPVPKSLGCFYLQPSSHWVTITSSCILTPPIVSFLSHFPTIWFSHNLSAYLSSSYLTLQM